MNGQGRQTGSMGDELTTWAMIALIGVFTVTAILRLAGTLTALFTGNPQPAGGIASGVGVLFHPGDPATALGAPGLSPVVYWIITALLLAALTAGGTWVWVLVRRHTHRSKADPHRLPGTATRQDITQVASTKALLHRASSLRPSLDDPAPGDVGYRLGSGHGRSSPGTWCSGR